MLYDPESPEFVGKHIIGITGITDGIDDVASILVLGTKNGHKTRLIARLLDSACDGGDLVPTKYEFLNSQRTRTVMLT